MYSSRSAEQNQNIIEDNCLGADTGTKDITNLQQKYYTMNPPPGKLVYKQETILRGLCKI
jgi:hypothetical protein